ncbi:MAG: hypothetical protein M1822_008146 [Bathelium mastoideum]|nr:MAG: hypothetical protein M1822_008146 [Bathelium mastoideum]
MPASLLRQLSSTLLRLRVDLVGPASGRYAGINIFLINFSTVRARFELRLQKSALKTVHTMTTAYTVSSYFTVNNIKTRTQLFAESTKIKIIDEDCKPVNTTANGYEQKPRLMEFRRPEDDERGISGSKQAVMKATTAEVEGKSRTQAITGTGEDQYSISSDEYLDIRDQIASALLTNCEGELDPTHPSVLLQSSSVGIEDYVRCLVERLAKDVKADYMFLDLEDLEDLALAFETQNFPWWEDPTENDKVVEGRDNSSLSNELKIDVKGDVKDESLAAFEQLPGFIYDSRSIFGVSEAEEETGSKPLKEIERETPRRDSAYALAKFYFGTPKPKGGNSSLQAERRNEAALDAIFNATTVKVRDGSALSAEIPVDQSTPLILFIHDATRIMDLYKGHRFLARLRDRVFQRRAQKLPTVAVFWCKEMLPSSSCSCCEPREKKRWLKKIRADSPITLSPKLFSKEEAKDRSATYTSALNVRRLKRALRISCSQVVNDRLTGDKVSWELGEVGNAGGVLGSKTLSYESINELVQGFRARAYSKPEIEIMDVIDVLRRQDRMKRKEETKPETKNAYDYAAREDLNKFEEVLCNQLVRPGQSRVTYDDVIMDPITKSSIRQLVALLISQPTSAPTALLEALKVPGIMFYGPAGTGKTQICPAIANDSRQAIVILSGADLVSKWADKSEEYVKAAFGLARKLKLCMIFLDEADLLFCRGSSSDGSVKGSALSQFLQEFDGLRSNNTDNDSPLVIVATKRPTDLDEAFLRRFPHKIFFQLPSDDQRRQILRLFLQDEELDNKVSIDALAQRTEGFSGSDLKTLYRQAALAWTREELQNGGLLAEAKVKLTVLHFDLAFQCTRPSTSPDMLNEFTDFAKGLR